MLKRNVLTVSRQLYFGLMWNPVLYKLYDTKDEKYLPYECNRISMMFE